MLTPARLRALAEIEATDASLCDATLKPIEDRRQREEMRGELDRIGQALEAEFPALGRGVAFFSSRKLRLWRQIAVSVPLPDGVWLSPRPYLRPLVRTQDEHDRFILVLLSEELSRFFISQVGQLEEVFAIRAH